MAELLTFTVPYKKGQVKPLVLAPLGDIQYTGKKGATALTMLKEHIAECLERDALFIGMGDYGDAFSPSNRTRLKAAALYDTAEDVIDDAARDLILELYHEVLKPTTGRWIGCLHGHHWSHLKTGGTTDTFLCELLKTRFLGTSAFIRLIFQYATPQMKRPEEYHHVVWAHHGCGGGMKAAAPLNRLENMAPYVDADLLLMGHTTKRPAAPIDRLTPRWSSRFRSEDHLQHKTIWLVNTGGFSESYKQGARQGNVPMGLYPEQGMMSPAALGAPLITITPTIAYSKDSKGTQHRLWAPRVRVEL